MTQEEKETILKLKADGKTCKEIGMEVGINPEAVKSFLRRSKQKVEKKPEKKLLCKQCGKPMEKSKHEDKVFCSRKCMHDWWNQNRTGNKTHICPTCKKKFKAYGTRKYCSHTCYIKDRYYD